MGKKGKKGKKRKKKEKKSEMEEEEKVGREGGDKCCKLWKRMSTSPQYMCVSIVA